VSWAQVAVVAEPAHTVPVPEHTGSVLHVQAAEPTTPVQL
jgi:hypothetical protein